MNIESVLIGLGYNANEALDAQVEKVVEECEFGQPDLDHIVNLHHKLHGCGGFVALSNSENVFKIKNETLNPTFLKEFNLTIHDWAEKYNFKVKKLDGKETYYITGKND